MIECDPTAQTETLPQGFELDSRIKILIVDDDDVCRELLRDAIDGDEVEAAWLRRQSMPWKSSVPVRSTF